MSKNINNTLILRLTNNNFFNDFCEIEKYYCCSNNNILLKLLRKLNSSLIFLFLGNWKKNLKNYKTIILFDTGYVDFLPKYIKQKNKKIKIIYWYWNSVCERGITPLSNKYIDEIWTYNRFDAKEYNLKYNPQFYYANPELITSIISENVNNDVVFLGRDKGREQKLIELKNKLETKNVKCNFHIVKDNKDFVNYNDYLKMVAKSKCILDLSYTLPCGLSLRPLEALYFNKKLITNNTDIVNYKFYNKNNIFILGVDDFNEINEFLKTPCVEISDEIKKFYSYPSWLERLSKGIEAEKDI